jgi:hypothetical protein
MADTHYVLAGHGDHGTISPVGAHAVPHGELHNFTIQADPTYHIATLIINGSLMSYPEEHDQVAYLVIQIGPVIDDNNYIQVTFSNRHIITVTHGLNGSVTPDGAFPVEYGVSQQFNFYPDEHYKVQYILVDGVQHTDHPTSYTFTAVTAPHTLYVNFIRKTVHFQPLYSDVIVISPRGVQVSGAGSTVVSLDEGTSQTFTFSIASGWTLDEVYIDGVAQGPITEYTFTHIMPSIVDPYGTIHICAEVSYNGGTNATMTGSGTEEDPWIILDREDLEAINNCRTTTIITTGYLAEGQWFALGDDIDLAGEDWSPIGAVGFGPTYDWNWWDNLDIFVGKLDGQGHIIKNMTIHAPAESAYPYGPLGLILYCGIDLEYGTRLENIHICKAIAYPYTIPTWGAYAVGFIAGIFENAVAHHCSGSGKIIVEGEAFDSGSFGGLFGWVDNCTLHACRGDLTVEVKMTGETDWSELYFVGGIAGDFFDSHIDGSYGHLVVRGTIGGDCETFYIGGLCGEIVNATADNCKATIDLDLEYLSATALGGVAWGDTFLIGGFTGELGTATVTDCSASGKIKIHGIAAEYQVFYIGGFVGCARGAVVFD